MTGTATILRGDARSLPLPDASVDLVCTSPPYWGLRDYRDGGESMAGQIGNEPTPWEYVDNLIDCTREWLRVLKPTGSLFVNIADAYANTATPEREGSSDGATSRAARPGRRTSAGTGIRPKSLYGLPWRYALRCIDELGLILRRDQIWHKISALPESVKDRSATRHEYLFHFVTQERYYAAVDLIRQPSGADHHRNVAPKVTHVPGQPAVLFDRSLHHPLGRLPGSVWAIAGEPLVVPDHIAHARCCAGTAMPGCTDELDHHAAFPTELPRRIVAGWSPSGICTGCGEGRRPVADRALTTDRGGRKANVRGNFREGVPVYEDSTSLGRERVVSITGYVCACPEPSAPTRPAIILDPFGGTGTTALVAKALGRHGISVDRSADYCRLAQWRTTDPDQLAKAMRVEKPPKQLDGQGSIFDELGISA
jgi:DNA modification methylase